MKYLPIIQWDEFTAGSKPETCLCHRCQEERDDRQGPWGTPLRIPLWNACLCGNKRCPRATDHMLACTGSNDPGQPGSIYAGPSTEPPK